MQISYWLHCFPELYFQRVKKEELSARVQYAALYLGEEMLSVRPKEICRSILLIQQNH